MLLHHLVSAALADWPASELAGQPEVASKTKVCSPKCCRLCISLSRFLQHPACARPLQCCAVPQSVGIWSSNAPVREGLFESGPSDTQVCNSVMSSAVMTAACASVSTLPLCSSSKHQPRPSWRALPVKPAAAHLKSASRSARGRGLRAHTYPCSRSQSSPFRCCQGPQDQR